MTLYQATCYYFQKQVGLDDAAWLMRARMCVFAWVDQVGGQSLAMGHVFMLLPPEALRAQMKKMTRDSTHINTP